MGAGTRLSRAATWESVKGIIDKNSYFARFQSPGHYNDMDMLEVGRGLTEEEDETHFGMWCMMASPLLIGCDLTTIKPETAKLLKNTDLIAIDQDPLGLQAEVAWRDWKHDIRVYVKPLAPAGSMNKAIALYNGTDEERTITAELDALGYDWNEVSVWDCFEHRAVTNTCRTFAVKVPPHGTRIYRIEPLRDDAHEDFDRDFTTGTAGCVSSAACAVTNARANNMGGTNTLAWFLKNVYGERPRAADEAHPMCASFEEERTAMDGAAVRRRVRVMTVGPFGTNSFAVTAFIPTAAKDPAPAFLLICNRNPKENIDPERVRRTEFWPAEEIVRRGYAAIAFYNGDIAPDCAIGNSEGVFAYFEDVAAWRREGRRPHDAWGTLSAWAWGASRVMDWIETEPRIDAKRVAVVGHSRGGKTALLAGVTDKRFAMACVNDSGCGGVKLNRMDLPKSEHIWEITRNFPYWFCANFRKWTNRDYEVPFDQDQFLALMAPRLVAVGSAADDDWAGPAGERRCCDLARSAWEDPSKVDYHVRPGGHDLNLIDWTAYMDFADRQWRSTDKGTDPVGGL